MQSDLSSMLHPELTVADAFRNLSSTGSVQLSSQKPVVLDKELPAVMLRLMTEMLSGYQRCLTLV
jgi:hypothetical protein